MKPGHGFHVYGAHLEYAQVFNGMQELRCGVQTELITAAEGGSKQAAAHQFKIRRKALEGGSSRLVLADVGCPDCLVDVLAPDNAGEREHR